MTSLFPDLRSDLVGAMERGPRRSRRTPVTLAIAVLIALLAFGATMLHRPERPAATPTVTATPTPSLPPAIAAVVRPAPHSPVLQLRVSDGTLQWDVAAWGTTSGTIGLTQAVTTAKRPLWGMGGTGTFAIASSLLAAPLGSLTFAGARKDGKAHYIVAGIVEGRANGVSVTLAGQACQAALSELLLTRPVVAPAALTKHDRRLAKTLPPEITVRLFAAAFELPKPTSSLRPVIRVMHPDGTWSRQYGAKYFIKLVPVR
jgi:hypothetical protein